MNQGESSGPDLAAQTAGPLTQSDRVVVVGASAGGVEALRAMLRALPGDLPAAVAIVLHMPAHGVSALVPILGRVSAMPVEEAVDGRLLLPGRVLVARPDAHLVVRDGRVHLGRGPLENGHRPAVDPLFRSAARWYGAGAVAVVLSGALDDGAAGALAVAARGGAVLVQDPSEALYAGMPTATQRAVPAATSAPVTALALRVSELVRSPPLPADPVAVQPAPPDLILEADLAELDGAALQRTERPGRPSGLPCPDCHGVLYEIRDHSMVRYCCRVGHAWSPDSLMLQQQEELESALWMALRALEDQAEMHRRMASHARDAGRARMATESEGRSTEATHSAEVLRQLLLRYDAVRLVEGGAQHAGG